MQARIATGLCEAGIGVEAFASAAADAHAQLEGKAPSLAIVFAGGANAGDLAEGVEAVNARLAPEVLIGCGAQGVVGRGRELEAGGVSVWAASFPDATVESFELHAVPTGSSTVSVPDIPDLGGADCVILLADPYGFPIEPVLDQLAEQYPNLPVLGGLASVAGETGLGTLVHGTELVYRGAVGVALSGVGVRACVSQGARPVGAEMVITAAERNVIYELASRPALQRLKQAISDLDEAEQALAAQGLLLGIVVDENQPEYTRGDFLIRGLMAVDEHSGSITVGEQVRVGQTVRLQVRDSASADEDLRQALSRQIDGSQSPPAGALVFTCNGRGAAMFGSPDHDASAIDEAFGGAPAGGFFCAGEIGPVGNRNFVHGFTATIAVFD